ncbi:MAG: carboxypeptidase-like regulatory domain-containing protein, partial [Bryobacteraceae bacterium]|nr:carboxypeptidase-like regulatory domain-containing protein [Bryobacteraceae bacterium]
MSGWIACFLSLLIVAAPAWPQALNGTLVGTITDGSGAIVPNAKVTLLEVNTNLSRASATNESGNYSFVNLPQGRYTVTIEQSGFRKASRENVELTINSTVRVDVQLQTGQINEQVTITAELNGIPYGTVTKNNATGTWN